MSRRSAILRAVFIASVWACSRQLEPIHAAPPSIDGCQIFPASNVWNTPVDTLPVHPRSNAYINTIGRDTHLHPDFGTVWAGAPNGIPFIVVPDNQPMVNVTFHWDDESDAGPYPIPADAPIEGGPSGTGDRHVLIVQEGACVLYELYRAFPNGNGTWRADSGAKYDQNSNALRPNTWTSADAAGLPMLPGLVRYDEVVGAGEIRHALRFTCAQTRSAHIWPARHDASSSNNPSHPPMGQRFRLKADFVIDSSYSPEARVILRAMKKYGIILADNGSNWYISGAPDDRWDDDALHDIDRVKGSDFEAVDTTSMKIGANSGKANLCAGDINGSGTVDAEDLFAVILNWGACPERLGGVCPPDITPVGGDGVVDEDDLQTTANNFGACE